MMFGDWHLCPTHRQRLDVHQRARREWTLKHPDPEPEAKIMRLRLKIREAVSKCGKCWPLETGR